jgi:predicted DNA-binding transcriptional regulator AlpA
MSRHQASPITATKNNLTPVVSSSVSTPTTASEILTVSEVAAFLKLAPSSVYELTRFRAGRGSSTIPCRRIGRNLRFLRSEIEAYVVALPKVAHIQKRSYRKRSAV